MNLGLFSSAAEAGPHDILKMYTPEGSLVNISNRLESNRPDAPYRLELVAAHFNQGIQLIIIISKKDSRRNVNDFKLKNLGMAQDRCPSNWELNWPCWKKGIESKIY